ncbi:MAG: LLM class flavin-dependent oxidoreductase [Chloroflexota bacterium]
MNGFCSSPNLVPVFQSHVARDAVSAGSQEQETGIVVGAVTVVDEDGAAARALARREVALYLPIVANLDPTVEMEPELSEQIRVAAERFDFEQASRLISDELLSKFAFTGTPRQIVEQASSLFAAGASRVEFGTPHGLTTEEGLRLLGKEVLPAIQNR